MIGIFTISGQASENQQETDYMERMFITSLNPNKREVPAPEVQASCVCRSIWTDKIAIQELPAGHLVKRKQR